MDLIRPKSISEIDARAIGALGLSEACLIRRAGDAVAREILARYEGGRVLILAGGGNNGADGYATALALQRAGVPALVADVFGKGQRSEGGRAVLAEYIALCGEPLSLATAQECEGVSILVEAVSGCGCEGALSAQARALCRWMMAKAVFRVAVDIPLGVDGDLGEVCEDALRADLTVVLSLPKRGLLSYPAKEYCGETVYASLDMGESSLYSEFFAAKATDAQAVRQMLPPRAKNSHKGTFGRVQILAGSKKYRGAAHLAALGAARLGAGLITLTTEEEVITTVGRHLPELLFEPMLPLATLSEAALGDLAERTASASALVVGPGLGVSEALYRFLTILVGRKGAPLLLDADALGAIARYATSVDGFFARAARPILLTPHPLELAHLVGCSVEEVQKQRMRYTLAYAKRWGVSLLLKGAGTLVSDGERLFINTTGSSALAKGGSGDVLAGAVGALLAQGCTPTEALAVGAYLHGAAGDSLASEVSDYGVLPSELPRRMAELITKL